VSGFSKFRFRVSGLGIRVDQAADGLEQEDRVLLVETVESDCGCCSNVDGAAGTVRPRRERYPAFGVAV